MELRARRCVGASVLNYVGVYLEFRRGNDHRRFVDEFGRTSEKLSRLLSRASEPQEKPHARGGAQQRGGPLAADCQRHRHEGAALFFRPWDSGS